MIDKVLNGFARSAQALGAQVHVVNKEKDEAARRRIADSIIEAGRYNL